MDAPGGTVPRRLCALTAGFWREPRLRRMLALAGHELRFGLPGPGDGVLVWGASPRAWRGQRTAAARGAALVRAEDAFLRGVRPGRAGGRPLGLILDPAGVHFDAAAPSRIETLLGAVDPGDAALMARAAEGIARLRALDLSKYNLHDPGAPAPEPGYVLVVDQVRGDASVRGQEGAFAAMLAAARAEHPGARIVVRAHPEAALGLRPGHFTPGDLRPGELWETSAVSPWRLIAGAAAVYAVSSQMGFEAVLAGQRPQVFGQPFYAGWGLTDDAAPPPRRGRRLTAEALFAVAMIEAPLWYDPCRDRLCDFEAAVDQLEAEVRAFRDDRRGHVAVGMRLWKRPRLQAFFGREKALVFRDTVPADPGGRGLLVWGRAAAPAGALRVEDGFLRSRGLGAALVPPLSLVADDLGLYYDPAGPSRLEALVAAGPPPGGEARALRLAARIVAAGVTKYNLPGGVPPLPEGHRVLVPGQVEDDASILLGAGAVRTNLALLQAVRAARPGAVVIYKPHPDVEAGLRPGRVAAAGLADAVVAGAGAAALIAACDEVWTMTSLLGFEALLRGKPVTCLGVPFYAGWGLTTDLGAVPPRRLALPRPGLAGLVHAALVAYPRYLDPVSGLPCPPEVAVERLASGEGFRRGPGLRLLARAQGWLASHAGLWRR
jgi:capsular polysaccharide export protein